MTRGLRAWQLGLAVFQALSTAIGFVQLLFWPQFYARFLAGTIFEGRFVAAALLLGVVVGGVQWAAIGLHLRRSRWLRLGHAAAGTVMLGWIAGECLVIDSFQWPHALWGGVGAVQVLLVAVELGVLRPLTPAAPTPVEEVL